MSKDAFSKKALESYWDDTALSIRPFFDAPSTIYYFHREKELFIDWFGDMNGKKLMKTDLWNEARNNKLLQWAHCQGAQIHAFDISNVVLNSAKVQMKGIPAVLKQGDIREIPFEDNSFDFIYSMGTIEHSPQYKTSLSELKRVLKPGGVGIIGVPNKYPWFDPLRYYYMKALDIFGLFPYGYEKHFTQKEFKNVLEDVGFKVLDESSIMLFPFALRGLDICLYHINKRLCNISKIPLYLFNKLETNSAFFKKRGGYLIACKVTK